MTSAMAGPAAVLLPGTGSDEVFVRAVFAGPLRAAGLELVAPPTPSGGEVAVGLLTMIDSVAERQRRPLFAGGISFGAHLAAEWALAHPDRCAGLLLALPAWHGDPAAAPAAQAAKASADLVEREGLEAALRLSVEGVQPWLAAELTRAWRRHGDGLAASLRAAADRPAPTLQALAELDIPVGIAACVDDPLHPPEVAHAWAKALPRAVVGETTLTALGADRESLGRAAVNAWCGAR